MNPQISNLNWKKKHLHNLSSNEHIFRYGNTFSILETDLKKKIIIEESVLQELKMVLKMGTKLIYIIVSLQRNKLENT